MADIKLEIGDFLGFCDLNGIEALDSEQVAKLESYIEICNEAHNAGESLVTDAIWDRLMDILRKVNPESVLAKESWEDVGEDIEDTDVIFKQNPMYSIMTVKSFDCDEIKTFVDRLPDDSPFQAHISVKLNGHGIRLKYQNGELICARSRARHSAGRDITAQLKACLGSLTHIAELEDFDICEVRGEWLLPFENVDTARQFNPDIKSAFSGVSSMGRDSASEEEWGLLRFVAYEFLAEDYAFTTKDEEYSFLEELGFEIPLYWLIDDLQKETLIEDLKGIVSDCENEVKPSEDNPGYSYYTDGLVFSINDINFFRSLGDDGCHYKFGNMALKVGYWKQDMYSGYVQTILWMKGKTKITPVAIVADSPDLVEFSDLGDHKYILDKKLISNYDDLGVITATGNKVRRVPLYEPNNILALSAYAGNLLFFRYGGEAGVVPCFEDGTPLLDGRVQNLLQDDGVWEEDGVIYSF